MSESIENRDQAQQTCSGDIDHNHRHSLGQAIQQDAGERNKYQWMHSLQDANQRRLECRFRCVVHKPEQSYLCQSLSYLRNELSGVEPSDILVLKHTAPSARDVFECLRDVNVPFIDKK